ncbi:MAG: fibronectin type III domain-containing protein, partial [Streptosporangiaceae bacterium]
PPVPPGPIPPMPLASGPGAGGPGAGGPRHPAYRWAVPAAAVVVVAALVVGLVIWAPWSAPPRPQVPVAVSGGQATTTSVLLRWSRPRAGPEPDHYLISRGGKIIKRLPGTARSYRDPTLAPASAYTYRVSSARGDQRSPASAPVVVRTVTPPVSAARLSGSWDVNLKIVSRSQGGNPAVGTVLPTTWQLRPVCPSGPCAVILSGNIGGGAYTPHYFTVRLNRSGGRYTGIVTAHISHCGIAPEVEVRNRLTIRLRVTGAGVAGQGWRATSMAGTLSMYSPYTRAGAYYCPAQTTGVTVTSR